MLLVFWGDGNKGAAQGTRLKDVFLTSKGLGPQSLDQDFLNSSLDSSTNSVFAAPLRSAVTTFVQLTTEKSFTFGN